MDGGTVSSKTGKVSIIAPLVAISWERNIYLRFIMNCVLFWAFVLLNFEVHGIKSKCACAVSKLYSEIKLWPSAGFVGLQWLNKPMSVLLWEQKLAQDEFRTSYLITKQKHWTLEQAQRQNQWGWWVMVCKIQCAPEVSLLWLFF